MGKWAKGHTKPKNALNPVAGMKDLSRRLKDDMTPDMPGETDEEKAIKNRQAIELSKLDEEENRRIKSMFAGGGGRKLFRNARSSGSRSSSSSSGGSSSGGGSASAGSGGAYRRTTYGSGSPSSMLP